jgi:hypothetical protein
MIRRIAWGLLAIALTAAAIAETPIQVRRGTSAQWAESARVMLPGEPGWDTTTGEMRFGDGNHTWADLPPLSAAHDEVTLGGTLDYLTLSGQQISRGAIDLASDTTGTLAIASGGTGGTTAAAARAAGYAEGSAAVEASRLLKEPEIAGRVQAHLAARAAKSSVTLATITASLLEMSEGRTLATVGVSEGTPIMGEPKHSDRLKATELLARLHGLDRHQVDLAIVPASAEALRRAAEARERVEAAERELTGEAEG